MGQDDMCKNEEDKKRKQNCWQEISIPKSDVDNICTANTWHIKL